MKNYFLNYGYDYKSKNKNTTEDKIQILRPNANSYSLEYKNLKQNESFSGRACLEFLSYQLLNLYLPSCVPNVKLGFNPIKNVYFILSEKIEIAKPCNAEQEYQHLLNFLNTIFHCAYIMGDNDITLENFAWGEKLLKIDPEIASRNFQFTPEAIDPAWLLCHLSDRINNRKHPCNKFHVTLLKFYNRVIGDFLDCLINLKNNTLNDNLRAHRTLIISSMQPKIGRDNVNFILEFLNDREKQFLEFLKNIKTKDYVFGERFSGKLKELSHFSDHKDLQAKIQARMKKGQPSIFSKLPFVKKTTKPAAPPTIGTAPSFTTFCGALRQSKLRRHISDPTLYHSPRI